jgi:hypothetical protein
MWRNGSVSTAINPMVIIALFTLFILAAGIIAALAIRINKGENALDTAKTAQVTADKAITELSDYKVHVAETYVSHAAMADVERRLSDQIKALGERIERLFHPAHPGT